MNRLSKIKYLIKINIRHAFNRIRMHSEKNENLTTFKTRFDSYKYLMLSFELINESITFQNFINDTLMNYLNEFVVVYLNDILIYSQNMSNHRKQIRKILQRFRKIEIQTNIDKCEFHVIETKFLKIIMNRDGIKMNLAKIAIILK